jgi:predicted RNA binding protein YcfA (HicA-like mRNA interferase family)
MSSIDYRKLRSLTARRLIRALERDGFVLEDRGKHLYYRHPDGRGVAVPFHSPGQTYPPKTLKKIIEREARWSLEDLKRLKLLPGHDP